MICCCAEVLLGTHSTSRDWGWPMFSTLLRETEMEQWIPTRWFQLCVNENFLMIYNETGLLLALRHQVQGAEAAGCTPAKYFPAFSGGCPVHRRGPGWGWWVPLKETRFRLWRPPQARCWWTARWGCQGAPPVCWPTSYSGIRCLLTKPSTQ